MPGREVWVVTLTLEGSLTEEQFDAWAGSLYAQNDEATLAQSAGHIYLTVWFADAEGHMHALKLIEGLLDEAGVTPALPVIGTEIRSESIYTRTAEEPSLPELVGAAEVAEILGVSRQRVHQLVHAKTIPSPLAVLRGGFVWDADAVRLCAEKRKGTRSLGSGELQ